MCGGGGGDDGTNEAEAADAARQAKITAGIANIDKVFNGTDTGSGLYTGAPAAGQTYYLADGTPVTLQNLQELNPAYQAPDTSGPGNNGPGSGQPNGGNSAGAPAEPQYLTKLGYTGAGGPVYQGDPGFGQLYTGTTHTGGFDDNFYNGISSSYDNYATPQLDKQYSDASDQLAYALARQGIGNSTGAGKQEATLSDEYNQYRDDIVQQGLSYADKARSDIADARNNLVNQVTATEDPGAASEGALAAAAIASQPQTFSPVGQFTFNVGSGLVNGINNGGLTNTNSSPYTTSPYSVGGTGSSSGSVQYVS